MTNLLTEAVAWLIVGALFFGVSYLVKPEPRHPRRGVRRMTGNEAKAIITKAFDDYDNGALTRASFMLCVEETTKTLAKSAYDQGFSDGEDAEIVAFESDMDFDDEDDFPRED
jgi:hypothetical protein